MLAGPSNYGLADPGNCAAISLTQLTTTLLTIKPNMDRLIILNTLKRFVADINASFVEVQKEIEFEEQEIQ